MADGGETLLNSTARWRTAADRSLKYNFLLQTIYYVLMPFFLLASDSMGEKNIYHLYYSLCCTATAVVPEQKSTQEKTSSVIFY